MPSIGPTELLIVFALVLLVFGTRRLPELGRSLGGGLRSFRESVTAAHDRHARAEPALAASSGRAPAESI